MHKEYACMGKDEKTASEYMQKLRNLKSVEKTLISAI